MKDVVLGARNLKQSRYLDPRGLCRFRQGMAFSRIWVAVGAKFLWPSSFQSSSFAGGLAMVF